MSLNPHVPTHAGRHGRHFVTTTGLQRASLSGGVKNATQRYALPPPAVAVRNLVRRHCCEASSHCATATAAGRPVSGTAAVAAVLLVGGSDARRVPPGCSQCPSAHTLQKLLVELPTELQFSRPAFSSGGHKLQPASKPAQQQAQLDCSAISCLGRNPPSFPER